MRRQQRTDILGQAMLIGVVAVWFALNGLVFLAACTSGRRHDPAAAGEQCESGGEVLSPAIMAGSLPAP